MCSLVCSIRPHGKCHTLPLAERRRRNSWDETQKLSTEENEAVSRLAGPRVSTSSNWRPTIPRFALCLNDIIEPCTIIINRCCESGYADRKSGRSLIPLPSLTEGNLSMRKLCIIIYIHTQSHVHYQGSVHSMIRLFFPPPWHHLPGATNFLSISAIFLRLA